MRDSSRPGSEAIATIGGMMSTNASGHRAVKYGTARDYLKADAQYQKAGHAERLEFIQNLLKVRLITVHTARVLKGAEQKRK